MYDCDHGLGAFGWLFITVFWVAFLGVIVWIAASLLPRRDGRDRESPEEVLRRRLARDEIDPQTYDELRAKLRD